MVLKTKWPGSQNGGGRAPHEPTDETRLIVKELYAAGIPQGRIAERLDIDEKVLRKYYRKELDENKDSMTAKLGSNLYQDALNGNQQSREFWLKCQGRWSYAKAPEDSAKEDKMLSLMEKVVDKL